MSERSAQLTPAQAAFLSDPALQAVMSRVEHASGAIRVNGGAVRDALLGRPVADVDLSTTLTPDIILALFATDGFRSIPTGLSHGTVTVLADGHAFEITTLREDVETDGRHAVVRFGTDWEADALRRDFTVNGLFCDRQGVVHDFVGGLEDIAARRLRFIGEPARRIAEDALRILRFFRFHAEFGQGRPDAEGLKACAAGKARLERLSAERVWRELKRLLGAPDPVRSVLWMRTTGVLAAVLPEGERWGIDLLAPLVRLGLSEGWPADPLLRLPAIVPDRPDVVEALASRLRLSGVERDRLAQWAAAPALRRTAPEPSGLPHAVRLALYKHGRRAVSDRLRLAAAAQALAEEPVAPTLALLAATGEALIPVLPIAGADLVARGHAPGPTIGRLLGRAEAEWIASDFTLGRDDLLAALPPPDAAGP